MPTILLKLTHAELARLRRLANHRKKTPVECLRGFIRTCQPGGSGWRPPGAAPAIAAETETERSPTTDEDDPDC